MGTVRRQVEIHRPADEVWAVVGDPSALHQWFPGIVSCTVDGASRVVTTASGLPLPEQILTVDPILRRFQYQVTLPMIEFHRGTIDVLEIDPDRCLVVYSTDCVPDVMALVIGGATGGALAELRRQLEPAGRSGGGPEPSDQPGGA